jgi:anti-sigma-K factor RskA
MNCDRVDELTGAYVLGAVDADERRAIEAHLASCARPHAELRAAPPIGVILAASTAPVAPSGALRDRVMASIAATAQEERPAATDGRARPRPDAAPAARRDWLAGLVSPRLLRGLALSGVAATLVLAVIAGSLWAQLQDRDRQLREAAQAIANGQAAFRVSGDAGSGYLVDTEGAGATLVLARVEGLPEDLLYALWLLDAEGTPVPVGTFRPGDEEIVVVPVDRDLAGFTTFALSVETAPVDQPSGPPVLTVPLEG